MTTHDESHNNDATNSSNIELLPFNELETKVREKFSNEIKQAKRELFANFDAVEASETELAEFETNLNSLNAALDESVRNYIKECKVGILFDGNMYEAPTRANSNATRRSTVEASNFNKNDKVVYIDGNKCSPVFTFDGSKLIKDGVSYSPSHITEYFRVIHEGAHLSKSGYQGITFRKYVKYDESKHANMGELTFDGDDVEKLQNIRMNKGEYDGFDKSAKIAAAAELRTQTKRAEDLVESTNN